MTITRDRRTTEQRRGFTLIELTMVIIIILLLAGVLLPAFGYILRQAKAAKVAARVAELDNGCNAYRMDAGCFPGQMYPSMLLGSTPAGPYTGSQMLALCLFTDLYIASATDQAFPASKYCIVNSSSVTANSDLVNFNPAMYLPLPESSTINYTVCTSSVSSGTTTYTWSTSVAGRPNTVSDRYSGRQLPILYYPARPGNTTLTMYVGNDNAPYLTCSATAVGDPAGTAAFPRPGTSPQNGRDFPINYASGVTSSNFVSFLLDTRYSSQTIPVNQGRYLLIAAGIDGLYGTPDDKKNW